MVVWMRNALLGCVNTWSSTGRAAWGRLGDATLLEEACHWGWLVMDSSLCISPQPQKLIQDSCEGRAVDTNKKLLSHYTKKGPGSTGALDSTVTPKIIN